MKKKKVLSAFLALAMATSLFSACGDKDKSSEATSSAADTTASSSAEPVIRDATISMLYIDNANYPYKADWQVLKTIKEKTGITLDMTVVPSSDYETKRQTVMADPDSMPDIISHYFALSEDAMSGLLLPISDYEDQMPNFKAFIENNGMREELDAQRAADGKYYTLPTKARSTKLQDQQWLIRTDIFEKNNIKVPTTLDEMYDAGVKLKKLYPESTPITNRFGTGNIMTGFAGAYGTIAGWTIGDGMYYDHNAKTWEYAPTSDKWKKMVTYVNKLLKDGVLDKEWATLDSTVYEQKIVEGKTFMMYDWAGNIVRYNNQGKAVDPAYNVEPIYPPKGEGDNYVLGWAASWKQGTVFSAKVKDKPYFEDLLRYIDWCFTDEAEVLLTFGIEGETFKVEDGTMKYIDPENVKYDAEYGLSNNSLCFRESADIFYGSFEPEQKALLQKIHSDGVIKVPNPASPLSAEQIEDTKLKNTESLDIANQAMVTFINEGVTDEKWAAYVKKIDSFAKEYTKMFNDEWAKRS